MGSICGHGPWKRSPYVQVSDVLCYKPIPIIYRTSLLQNSLKVIISYCFFNLMLISHCRSFPNCKFGDKCLYIHPNCKFDASCTRRDCPFTHASPRNMTASVSATPVRTSQQVCKFFPKCSNVNCKFLHPKVRIHSFFCQYFSAMHYLKKKLFIYTIYDLFMSTAPILSHFK